MGLGLGVRASWAPLLVPMLVLARPAHRVYALTAALVAVLAWAIPFVWIVGPFHLAVLLKTHLVGHTSRWGGTAITDPVRLRYLARDVFVDGLGGGGDALGLTILAVGAVSGVLALIAWRRRSWCGWRAAMTVVAPYLVLDRPRSEPAPAASSPAPLSWSRSPRRSAWPPRSIGASEAPILALFALTAVRSATDAHERRTIPRPARSS